MTEQISDVMVVIGCLSEIQSDATVPKNVRVKIELVHSMLRDNSEFSIKVNKALSQLDEIANDVNLQSYTRTQIWNAMSVLEKL